jgi:DNA-binding winged helix-turn-helix (wHTH) protein
MPVSLRFGPFTLNQGPRQLLRGTELVHLSHKAFDLLTLLIERRPDAVSKAEAHSVVWPDTFVSDVNLAVLIAEVREALEDDARRPHFIRTVHRFGYAFCAPVTEARRQAASVLSSYWLAWGSERVALNSGDNLIGRDPAADVRIDAIGVSRRHATICVADDSVTLRDLSSKNGTYVGDRRVTSSIIVSNGAEIRLGPVTAWLRCEGATTSTQTLRNSRGGVRSQRHE